MSESNSESFSESASVEEFFTLRWQGEIDGCLQLLDQTKLPHQEVVVDLHTPEEVIEAIVKLSVRGAPAIGVAGAYALCLATRNLKQTEEVIHAFEVATPLIRNCRPTAINLATMVDRMAALFKSLIEDHCSGTELRQKLLEEAQKIEKEDQGFCQRIGESGAHLIHEGGTVLTHCNAGALATAGSGTALSVIYQAWESGRRFKVIADETRPLLQGSRITAWELQRHGIPVEVICDGAAGSYFQRNKVDIVITGADRVAANGDAANKIGTYMLATLAKAHEVPFYIAAPSSTFDFQVASGVEIPIEERAEVEIYSPLGEQRPSGEIRYGNPAFDISPATLIEGWITEAGILQPPFEEIR